MIDPRRIGLPWPFVAVDEEPYIGVEIAPNEIVYVVLAGTYRELREAAEEQVTAANEFRDIWNRNGGRA